MSLPLAGRRLPAPGAWLRAYLAGEAFVPILVLCGLTWADQVDTQTFGVLGPEIARHFHVGVGVFGTINVIVLILVPFVSLPVSYAADRWKRMPLAIAGAATWAVFSVLTGLAPSLFLLIGARVGASFGEVVNIPVHGALISDFYSQRSRIKAFGIHGLGSTAGAALGAVAAGAIGQAAGWRAPFFVLAVPTMVVVVAASRLREPPRGRFEVVEARETPPLLPTARRLWALRSLRYQYIGAAWAGGSVLGIGTLVPFFLKNEFGVRPGLRGVIMGVGTALSAVAIIAGTAAVQGRLQRRPSDALRLICWSGVAAAAALALLSVAPTLILVVLLIWVIICVFAFVTPGLRAIVAVVAPPEIRSTAFALAGIIALAGSVFALAGFWLGDRYGMRWAVAAMAPVFFRGVLYFFRATRYIDDDVARLDPAHAARAKASGDDQRTPVLLEVKDLTVYYGDVQVLFGVDLEVRQGEIVALLGTNGAGKSTTLNAISGLLEPRSGNVFFDGEAITGEPPESSVGRGIVQVPGGRGVFPGLTVEENLKMGMFVGRRRKAQTAARLAQVLDLFPRLGERLNQNAGALSGGERQMLTLGQSLLLEPRLLLIDELSLGLSPVVVRELLAAVRRLNAEGIAIMLVEQSVNVALTLAQRAYFMEKGMVRFSGPTRDLIDRPDVLRSIFLEGAAAGLQR